MITLVLGGVRSGKSAAAERFARACGEPVTYIATATSSPGDAAFSARIEQHRARRPPSWPTIEAPRDLAPVLARLSGTVIVDALGSWIANTPGFAVDVDELCHALTGRGGDTVVVSDEVGLAVHPMTETGRRFVDAMGECNQAVAAVADRAVLVVAGRTLELGSL
ncbi:MAG TPA: bifunctional adenosylcobinamide kinase/adenosylcobinamide-phosphate guanylyltransferase [Acidimicrobiia bacterium]|nr:bifunctional adenosylcobinamide kinase/adenosylcobinamide-phosphate guanylyltransferase [Acidimicrobiia bacterium]